MERTRYGIASCTSCRKARSWLDDHGIRYSYHDLRLDGMPETRLSRWVEKAGWEKVLNRRSATWRQLSDVDKMIAEPQDAVALMLRHPTLVKRPVLDDGRTLMIGFEDTEYQRVMGKKAG